MGRHSYGVPISPAYSGDKGDVSIGAYCAIAENVVLMVGGNHRTDWVSTFPLRARLELPGAFMDGHPATRGPIRIGNDVWIGRDAMILSGVTIGDGAVVGARAVVGADVRPYAVVVGNPAREVRRRFTDNQVDDLLRIAWWEWSDEDVQARVDEINGGAVDTFIARYGGRE
jgi:acetyltransferase-like isoleucine patch superfamily enzyme